MRPAISSTEASTNAPTTPISCKMASSTSTSASIAQKTFEMENEMVTLDPNVDGIFRYDKDADRQAMNQKPWKTE